MTSVAYLVIWPYVSNKPFAQSSASSPHGTFWFFMCLPLCCFLFIRRKTCYLKRIPAQKGIVFEVEWFGKKMNSVMTWGGVGRYLLPMSPLSHFLPFVSLTPPYVVYIKEYVWGLLLAQVMASSVKNVWPSTLLGLIYKVQRNPSMKKIFLSTY